MPAFVQAETNSFKEMQIILQYRGGMKAYLWDMLEDSVGACSLRSSLVIRYSKRVAVASGRQIGHTGKERLFVTGHTPLSAFGFEEQKMRSM